MGGQIARIKDNQPLREALEKRVKMYENDWDDILEKEIRRQFSEQTAPGVILMADTSLNVFRRIVREICTVYKEPAARTVRIGGEDQEVPRYDQIVQSSRLDVVMAEAHRLSKAGTCSFLLVRAVPGTDRIRYAILTPDRVWFRHDDDDPMKLLEFAYQTTCETMVAGKSVDQEVWVYYTDSQRLFLDASGKELESNPFTGESMAAYTIPNPEGADTFETYIDPRVNKYGCIPVVPFPAVFPVGELIRPKWNHDAYRANLTIAMFSTYMGYLVKTQSFKQIVLSGDNVAEDVKGAILDPLNPLTLGKDAKAYTMDLNTRLEAIDAVIQGKVAAIANQYGVSMEQFRLTGAPASGFSLVVSNQALAEIRKADIPLCQLVEGELYRVTARVNNIELPGSLIPEPFSDQNPAQNVTLFVDPGEVNFPKSIDEEQKTWLFEFDNGISNAVDYVISKNPEATRETAIASLQIIAEENATLKPPVDLASALASSLTGKK